MIGQGRSNRTARIRVRYNHLVCTVLILICAHKCSHINIYIVLYSPNTGNANWLFHFPRPVRHLHASQTFSSSIDLCMGIDHFCLMAFWSVNNILLPRFVDFNFFFVLDNISWPRRSYYRSEYREEAEWKFFYSYSPL